MKDKAARPGRAWPAPEMAENRGADTIVDLVAERRTNGTAVLRRTVAAEADLVVAVAMAERFIKSEVVQKRRTVAFEFALADGAGCAYRPRKMPVTVTVS